MGADGGRCEITCNNTKDVKTFYRLCFFWSLIENDSECEREEYDNSFYTSSLNEELIINSFYSDGNLPYSLRDLVEIVSDVIERRMNGAVPYWPEWWKVNDIPDIRDTPIGNIIHELNKFPKEFLAHNCEFLNKDNQDHINSDHYLSQIACLKVLKDALTYYVSKNMEVPVEVKNLTVREWAQKLSDTFDINSFRSREIWT